VENQRKAAVEEGETGRNHSRVSLLELARKGRETGKQLWNWRGRGKWPMVEFS
jgi:hypothetical protein